MSAPADRAEFSRTAATASRGWQLVLLSLAYSVAVYARVAMSPLQEPIQHTLGLSDNQIALLQGPLLAVPIVVAAIPLGALVDRYSRVRLLRILLMLDVVGGVMTAEAPNFGVLCFARALIGLTTFATNPVALSILSDLYPATRRGRALIAMALGSTAATSLAFAGAGALLESSRMGQSGWREVMLLLTIPIVPVLGALIAMREPPRTDVVVKQPSFRQAIGELWSLRQVVVPLLAIVAMAEIAYGAVLVWAAPGFSRSLQVPLAQADATMGVVLLVSGIVGPMVGGSVADLCQRIGGPRRTLSMLGVAVLLCIPFGVFSIIPTYAVAAVTLGIFMTVVTGAIVVETAVLIIVVPNELRGVCTGIMVACSVLVGTGLAPLTVSLLSGAIQGISSIGEALSIVCVATSIGGAAICLASRKHFAAEGSRDSVGDVRDV